MLGRGVAERLHDDPKATLVSPEVLAVAAEADVTILNLECCISERGERWPDPSKPFFFRAPPVAVDTLRALGVGCVTLANNHALDYGTVALADTFAHLEAAGIAWVGAGPDLAAARSPALLAADGQPLSVVGFTDHPAEYAAGVDRSGVAYADLRTGVPGWLTCLVEACTPPVVVLAHWGPNMATGPAPQVRDTAAALERSGATLVVGHSAHVFHGVAGRVLFDLGDFVDDYRTDSVLRNDLGLLWLVTLDECGPRRLEAVPLTLEYCYTRLAVGDDARWVRRRLRAACSELGTDVVDDEDRLVFDW